MSERKTPQQKKEELEKKIERLQAQKKPYKRKSTRKDVPQGHAALSRTAHLLKSTFLVKI